MHWDFYLEQFLDRCDAGNHVCGYSRFEVLEMELQGLKICQEKIVPMPLAEAPNSF